MGPLFPASVQRHGAGAEAGGQAGGRTQPQAEMGAGSWEMGVGREGASSRSPHAAMQPASGRGRPRVRRRGDRSRACPVLPSSIRPSLSPEALKKGVATRGGGGGGTPRALSIDVPHPFLFPKQGHTLPCNSTYSRHPISIRGDSPRALQATCCSQQPLALALALAHFMLCTCMHLFHRPPVAVASHPSRPRARQISNAGDRV